MSIHEIRIEDEDKLKASPNCLCLSENKCRVIERTPNALVCSVCLKMGGLCDWKGEAYRLSAFKKIAARILEMNVQQLGEDRSVFHSWQRVKHTWIKAGQFMEAVKSRGLVATARDVAGLGSTAGERVDEATYQLRRKSCFGGDGQPPCPKLKRIDEKSFCDACGCGKNKLARLDEFEVSPDTKLHYTKLHYPKLNCPLKRPGFSNHQPHEAVGYYQHVQ